MDLHTIPIITLLCMALVSSYAATVPEIYWKAMLPNIPMPEVVRNSLLHSGPKSSVSVTSGPKFGITTKNSAKTYAAMEDQAHVGTKSSVSVTSGPKFGLTTKNSAKTYAAMEDQARMGTKSSVSVTSGPKFGITTKNSAKTYAAMEDQAPVGTKSRVGAEDKARALFFLEKDMKLGSQMTLLFSKSTNMVTFLPREEAASIPFSSAKMPEILHKFSVQTGSNEALIMEETVKECETKNIKGETKYCATSLESMIDFAISNLGSNHIKAISTAFKGKNTAQNYTITGISKAARDDQVVACHKQNYAYTVFYCHKSKATYIYTVSLAGADGSSAKAVTVCHKDTSQWDPNHLAFQILNVKPGSVPICHFLQEDHVVWLHSN